MSRSLLFISIVTGLAACGDDGSSTPARSTDSQQSSDTAATDTADSTDTAETADAGTDTGTDTGLDPSQCPELVDACAPSPGFISTDALESLADANVRIVDLRDTAAFEAGHIPGATQLDPGALRATVDGVSGQVAAEADVRAAFEAAGIAPEDAVVIYGPNNGTDPSRVVWTLAYHGHQGPVWTLDGGFDQWSGEQRATETGTVTATATTYPTALNAEQRVDAAWVLERLDDPNVLLVDARSQKEFDAGRIPGALLVNWTTNLNGEGLLLPNGDLDALYGPPPADTTLVVYCRSGSRAAVDWVVLKHLGYSDVRLYDGSWAEWSANPDNPQEMM